MSHFEGREWSVSGLEGHRDFARALTAPPPAEFEPKTQNLSVEFLTRINDTEIVQELADAFRANQWLTGLTLLADDADDLVPILSVLPQCTALKYLELYLSYCAPSANEIAGMLVTPFHKSLRELHFVEALFTSNFASAWTAIEENGTLERVGFWGVFFDAPNTQYFKACMLKAKFILVSRKGCQFEGETIDDIMVTLMLKSKLKGVEIDVDTADFVERLLSLPELKNTVGDPLPEMLLATEYVEVAQAVINGLPYVANLRGLSLYYLVPGEDTITKALATDFLAALKRNGSFRNAHFFDHNAERLCRREVKYGKKFPDAFFKRNEQVPLLLKNCRDTSTATNENVGLPSAVLLLTAFQSDHLAPTTAIAAMNGWEGRGMGPSDKKLASRALVVASEAADEAAAAFAETATEFDAAIMEEEQAVVAHRAAVGKVQVAVVQASLASSSANAALNAACRIKESLSRQRVTAMAPAASALAMYSKESKLAAAELANAILAVEAAQIKSTQAKVKNEAAAAKSLAAHKDLTLALVAYKKTVKDEVAHQETVEEADSNSPTAPSNNGYAVSAEMSLSAGGSSVPSAPVVAYNSLNGAEVVADFLARFFFF